jgi:hypothetical protein
MFVYFIQAEGGGPIKIGRSRDPQSRLSTLQTAHGARLRILSTRRGSSDVERGLHARFAAHRTSGEWFEPVPELVAEATRQDSGLQVSPDPSARLRPQTRLRAREDVSVILRGAIERHGSYAGVASRLGVSESVVRRWCDSNEESHQVSLADCLALSRSGWPTLASAVLDEVRATLHTQDEGRGWSLRQHALELGAKSGACSAALTRSSLNDYDVALAELARAVEDARADFARLKKASGG